MSWYEDSVQVTVQDAGEAAVLEKPVEVSELGLDGLRQQAVGDRVQHAIHDVDDDILVRDITQQDVGTSNGDRPAVVVDLDEDVVAARRGDLEVAAKAAAGHRVAHDVVQHKFPQKSTVRLQHLDDARRQSRERQVIGCDDCQGRQGCEDVFDLGTAQVLAEDGGVSLLEELV